MPIISEAHVALSARLLEVKRGGGLSADDTAAAAGRVHEALCQTLDPIIGQAGVHAIFIRSLRLTTFQFPGLAKVVAAEPPAGDVAVSDYLVLCLRKLEPLVIEETAVGLFAVFLGLLTDFIGESLLRRIVQKAFSNRGNELKERK